MQEEKEQQQQEQEKKTTTEQQQQSKGFQFPGCKSVQLPLSAKIRHSTQTTKDITAPTLHNHTTSEWVCVSYFFWKIKENISLQMSFGRA